MNNKKYIYLDTNAFRILEDHKTLIKFKNWLDNKEVKPILSSAAISELFRFRNKFKKFNSIVNYVKFLYMGAYDKISELERNNYPNKFDIEEISLNEKLKDLDLGLFNKLDQSIRFKNSLKVQIEAAEYFVRVNFFQIPNKKKLITSTKNRLIREFGKSINFNYFKTEMIIIKFLYRKHLLQKNRRWKKSDFIDMQHIAFSPYMGYFITDEENCEVLRQIKNDKDFSLLSNTLIMDINKFKKLLYA